MMSGERTTPRELVNTLLAAAAQRQNIVLATVVHIEGSSYGGVGSRMVCPRDGSTVGMVSGGCLEADLAEHAQRVFATGHAEVVRYDTRDDDEIPWGLGLGCNGLIEVLLEPLLADQASDVAGLLAQALAADSPSAIATVIRSRGSAGDTPHVGSRALLGEGAVRLTGDWGNGSAVVEATQHMVEALAAGRRGVVLEIGSVDVAYEVVMPATRLVICGAGPDAAPVARFASMLGWDVVVVDHRPLTEAHAARFPGARVVECGDAVTLTRALPWNQRFAAVVMTHNLGRDREYVHVLLNSDVTYLGVLGSRARTQRMLGELIAREGPLPDMDDRFFSPAGLDTGGEGPDAIALAIVSQISAVISGTAGGHLRDRRGAVHTSAAVATAAGIP